MEIFWPELHEAAHFLESKLLSLFSMCLLNRILKLSPGSKLVWVHLRLQKD